MDTLRQEYLFIPAKVKEVYLMHLLNEREELGIRSAMIFVSTCKVCVVAVVVVKGGMCVGCGGRTVDTCSAIIFVSTCKVCGEGARRSEGGTAAVPLAV